MVIEYNLVKYRDLCFARPENPAKIHRLVGTRLVTPELDSVWSGTSSLISLEKGLRRRLALTAQTIVSLPLIARNAGSISSNEEFRQGD